MSIPFLRNSYDTQDDATVKGVVLGYAVAYPTESRQVVFSNGLNLYAGYGTNNGGIGTISFHDEKLTDGSVQALNWSSRTLWDDTGEIVTARWGLGILEYGNTSLDWINRLLYKSDGTTVTLDWQNGILNGTATNVSGVVAAANGGTGLSSYAVGDLLYASASTTLSKLADVATGNALISGGVATAPSWGKIGLTTHVTGTLGATNGGTGVSTVTTGDLLYGSAANTWSKLAGVATGNALISGGVSTAPSWGKIGLTTHISGTLAVGNGGTGQTSFTASRILYGNGSSAISSSASFKFDGSNLLLGTTTFETYTLSVGAPGTYAAIFQNTADSSGCWIKFADSTNGTNYGFVGIRGGDGFFQSANAFRIETGGGLVNNILANGATFGNDNGVSASVCVWISNNTTFCLQIDGGDDATTPTNTATPVGWLHVSIDGTDSWMPYYR